MTDIPKDVKEFFRKHGEAGGKKSAAAKSPEQLKRQARKAAKARWAKKGKGK